MMAQQMAAEQQAAAQQQMGMEGMQNQMAGAPSGQGFNPQAGGLPPQMAAPEATREGVSGLTQGGVETNLPLV